MTIALITLLGGAVTVAVTTGATLWSKRTRGPEAHASLVNASTLFLAQLQNRISVLEKRLDLLEAENARLEETVAQYVLVYGPLEN